jgi:hypothetical protein
MRRSGIYELSALALAISIGCDGVAPLPPADSSTKMTHQPARNGADTVAFIASNGGVSTTASNRFTIACKLSGQIYYPEANVDLIIAIAPLKPDSSIKLVNTVIVTVNCPTLGETKYNADLRRYDQGQDRFRLEQRADLILLTIIRVYQPDAKRDVNANHLYPYGEHEVDVSLTINDEKPITFPDKLRFQVRQKRGH